ncbi:P-loop containing nucleoside triphosphate hydrolase protein [Fomitiporia mediterranea MF3/22]|uniref:P-loop containing nucleoside triphosphate hydrolase protein n=1 Tax=Fomitiporia mediterranea (strain MF3/22) TaxID=694068 RepID=UPI0004408997|nr:P-loop containing nucleoside triphosphate hydrolase protein [Fomitiporia mediterranea MF3/22]EJD01662.1 P-loop containing nucleoside triphosphate hydrolase protein [Fomitiporia mediterranea MF3/22]
MAKKSKALMEDDISTDDLLRRLEDSEPQRKRLDSDGSADYSHANGTSGDASDDAEVEIAKDSSRISLQSKPRIPTLPKSTASKSIASFADLGASKALVASLASMSIRSPTEVQVVCIPPLLADMDCVGNVQTGSGKTIAFALPVLQKLSLDPYGIYALVLTPTRELAFQISEQFAVLGAPLNIQTAIIVGGMDMITQALELNNRPHVVVATPGRIVII